MIAVEYINSVEYLDNLIQENKTDTRWSKLIGFYNKVTQKKSEDMREHMSAVISLHDSLYKKGYKLSREVMLSLLGEGVKK